MPIFELAQPGRIAATPLSAALAIARDPIEPSNDAPNALGFASRYGVASRLAAAA